MAGSSTISAIFQNTINFFSKKPNNAQTVSRARQYSGEYSKDLPYYQFYIYYHQQPTVKRDLNSIHKKWMGSKIEVKSKSAAFDQMWKLWDQTVGFVPKLKEFALDTLITGTGLFEKQYYNGLLSNIEHIPTKTLFRIYRDEFANILSIWQQVDGDIKQHDPSTLSVFTINNPERDAVGKSEMYAVAVPQLVAGALDSLGNPINPARYLPSILDMRTRLNFAHMEIAEKQAKAKAIVSLKNLKDTDRQKDIEKDLESGATSKFVTVTDSDIDVKMMTFPNQVGNERYLDEINKLIAQGTGFPENVIDEGSKMGFAAGALPMQDFGESIEDKQNNLSEFIQNEIFKALCVQWKIDFAEAEPKLVFTPFIQKITVDQITNLLKTPDLPLADTEKRSLLKEIIPGMNDQEWEDFQSKLEERRAEEMKMQAQGDTKTGQNKRPEIEKTAQKPSIESGPYSYFPLPPMAGEPYESPEPEITNNDTLLRIKKMLEDAKSGKLKEDDLKKEIESISREIDSIQYWIKELKKNHPDWKQDQVVSVAIKKSKEAAPTPHVFKPNPAYPAVCMYCSLSPDDIIHSAPKSKKKQLDDNQ